MKKYHHSDIQLGGEEVGLLEVEAAQLPGLMRMKMRMMVIAMMTRTMLFMMTVVIATTMRMMLFRMMTMVDVDND